MQTAPFMQFATLPVANGSLDRALAIYKPFAQFVEQTVPGCLEFALYSTTNTTGAVDIIIAEHYVDTATHDNFTASDAYQQMLQQTNQQGVLRGAPVLTVVNMVGGFTDRSPRK
ncbi:hypothetical protein F4820DRAFT_443860 [Hypoxylon rubiginosum]|uniref:Uncharacterized protein n=1 Tax=Hypoxylon rubiginosum TaxID=110542 RepID=A0ACB9ZDI9_9PEZI|nr:hypothetical protein F4820DRAFT_443860 [Hypoxylon rubiginosum]